MKELKLEDKFMFMGRSAKAPVNERFLNARSMSNQHAVVYHDPEYGWVISEEKNSQNSTNGTWVHPKNWSQARLGIGANSLPVEVFDGDIIRASVYEFQINIT